MIKFRNITPTRRTNVRSVNKASEYKSELREDFNRRCGYCDDVDSWRDTFYEVDHFVPKVYLKTISENNYSNLVYSCRHCNNAKRAKWPTKCEKKHNNGSEGFIDPCDLSYDAQFYRNSFGEIKPKTALGEYMYKEMKLYLRRHVIVWKLERLDNLIREMKMLLGNSDELLSLYQEHKKYIDELHGIQ
jgi:hypothetical protein